MTPTGNLSSIVDSSLLIAFFNKEDELFSRSKALLKSQESPLVIIDAVLHETLALLRKRVGKKIAHKAAEQFLDSAFFNIHFSGETVLKNALELFIAEKARYSFADCVIITEARIQKIPILTFDRHFKNFDLTVIP